MELNERVKVESKGFEITEAVWKEAKKMAVTAEEKAALVETQGVLDRGQAIDWCVENLEHWPRIVMGSSYA